MTTAPTNCVARRQKNDEERSQFSKELPNDCVGFEPDDVVGFTILVFVFFDTRVEAKLEQWIGESLPQAKNSALCLLVF